MEVTIDIDKLRDDLRDYFGAAAFAGIPGIIMEMFEVDNMSPEELVECAIENKFDLNKYVVGKTLHL